MKMPPPWTWKRRDIRRLDGPLDRMIPKLILALDEPAARHATSGQARAGGCYLPIRPMGTGHSFFMIELLAAGC